MPLDTDRGLLSSEDRQYLRDATEEQKYTEKGNLDSSRIRREIYHGLRDFDLIATELENWERQDLFERLPDDRDLQRGIESTLAFLYRGLEETNQDFEDVLASALQGPEEGILRGRIARNGNGEAILEIEPDFFALSTEPEEYTDEELGMLLFAGQIDGDEALDLLQAREQRRAND